MSTQVPPVSVQEAVISSIVNTILFDVFLWGVYTIVYIGTLSTYLRKKSSRHWVVIATISLAYLVYVAQEIVNWNGFAWHIVYSSQSQEDLFLGLVYGDGGNGSKWPTFVNDLCSFLLAALADGLMIWRCYNVWDRSLRAIAIPCFLLFCEIVLDLVIILITCVEHLNPTTEQGFLLNKLLGASLFITFATTTLSTLLISYRIHTVAKEDITRSSKKLFKRVVEILVQSATAYSITTLANAIPTVISYTPDNAAPLFAAQTACYHISLFVAGVAPTIMVARVAFLDEESQSTSDLEASHISDLRFHVRSTTLDARESKVENDDLESQETVVYPKT